MKKPKKISAAKTPPAVSKPAKTRAQTPEKEPVPAPKKSPVKRAGALRSSASKTESEAKTTAVPAPKRASTKKPVAKAKISVKTETVAEVKPVEETKTKVRAKVKSVPVQVVKPVAEVKPPGATLPMEQTKPEAKPAAPPVSKRPPAKKPLKAEVKAEPVPEVKPAEEIKPQSKIQPAIKPAPAKEIKPAAEVKAPAVKPSLPSLPKPELKPAGETQPVAAAKKTKAPAKPKAKTKLVVVAKTIVALKSTVEPQPVTELKPAAPVKAEIKKATAPVAVEPIKQSFRPIRKAPANIPPILLEGDRYVPPPPSGPGQRYALGPTPPVEKLQTEGELPESYGTGSILLTARDPHWLYTHWDFTDTQQRRYNAFSRDGHLVVRVYVEAPGGKPVAEVHVHPESRHWFLHVDKANTRYVAELGYYSAAERWTVVATSAATLTPPNSVSTESVAEFSTIPFEVPMEKLLTLVKEAVHENAPLAEALQELRAEGHMKLPEIAPTHSAPTAAAGTTTPPSYATPSSKPKRRVGTAAWAPSEWTPSQERALAKVISMDHVRRVWMGSLEITELIRRQLQHAQLPQNILELGAPGAPTSPTEAIGAAAGITSPSAKAAQPQKGFWFNVNAELIVYGATEPDATVSIGGRKIKLRPDGSFSYRFALPDGNYEMPVVAVSADGTDGRAAELKFKRETEYRGHVEAHPQDPALQPLRLENF